MLRRRLVTFTLVFLTVVLPAVLGGCAAAEPAVELRGRVFAVEIAQTREAQARGLMFREELAPDRGMLFIFPRESLRSFWMKNTRISLDILYFDRDLTLVSMAQNARPCLADPCPTYPSSAPAQYVLELNAGTARALGAQTGDRLVLLFEP